MNISLSQKQKMTIEFFFGFICALIGIGLLWTSLFIPPVGIIDASVLAAVGEVLTFSGALVGIDYSYRFKHFKIENGNKKDD